MEVAFTKKAHAKDFPPWVARKGKQTIQGSHLGSDPRHLPHDIVTLVVERELGIDDGFFAAVFAGATFKSMVKARKPHGKAVVARYRPGLDRAEMTVNAAWAAWRDGVDAPANAALDAARDAWLAVPPGGTLTLPWHLPPRRR